MLGIGGTKAPVSEGRDDESFGAAEELVLVFEVDVSDADETLVHVVDEVEASLLQPLEIRRRFNVHLALKWKRQN